MSKEALGWIVSRLSQDSEAWKKFRFRYNIMKKNRMGIEKEDLISEACLGILEGRNPGTCADNYYRHEKKIFERENTSDNIDEKFSSEESSILYDMSWVLDHIKNDKKRVVLSMMFEDEIKSKDIAIILGISDSRVSSIKREAVSEIRKELNKRGITTRQQLQGYS